MADIHEIRIYPLGDDPRAHDIERQAAHLGLDIELETNTLYYVEGITDEEAEKLSAGLLSDPNTQRIFNSFPAAPRI